MMQAWTSPALVVLLLAGGVSRARGDDGGRAAEEFFENSVRPLLSGRCWTCHGETKQFAGLRLDTRAAVIAGGDSGPAIEPGKPAESLLIDAVKGDGASPMPPPGKGERLSEKEVGTLTAWIEGGAVWPASPTAPTPVSQAEHWAFQPVRAAEPPAVKQPSWVRTPVDAFVLSALEKAGLTPSDEADRRTLIRRLSFDLQGLPPTPEEVKAFEADDQPDAYERLVDRLLASPRYGERWARHWLDVARYSDTKGYVFQEEREYPFAYTYRDWVINALNSDMPYDRFIEMQLAADRLAGDNKADLAAMGFLTVGRRFLNRIEDITDDRIDVTMRGLQGLTVGCARCHDHKYDPIPTADYYSLYGVFVSSEEPAVLPLLGTPPTPETPDYEAQKAKLQADVDAYLAERLQAMQGDLDAKRAEYLSAAEEAGNGADGDKVDRIARERKLRVETLGWLARKADRQDPRIHTDELRGLLNADENNNLRSRENKLPALDATHPGAPARGMVMVDRAAAVEPHIFLRGNSGRPGPAVPRQFLKVLAGPNRAPFAEGSGRLELARAIASPTNPLTARVMVNRVWMHHFGQALVRTPSDFGLRSESPTNPELLDWLASRFMAEGWSLKRLHRRIVLSSTYRQRSDDRPDAREIDPENTRLWRQNRQRLEFEPLRDTLLYLAGRLDERVGGRAVEIGGDEGAPRRTIYGHIDRQNLDGLLRAFDFASPDATAPRRFVTTVPQQALYLMNHPFPAHRARELADRVAGELKREGKDGSRERITRLYLMLYGRVPEAAEIDLGLAFVGGAEGPPPAAETWGRYAQALLLTNEMMFID